MDAKLKFTYDSLGRLIQSTDPRAPAEIELSDPEESWVDDVSEKFDVSTAGERILELSDFGIPFKDETTIAYDRFGQRLDPADSP